MTKYTTQQAREDANNVVALTDYAYSFYGSDVFDREKYIQDSYVTDTKITKQIEAKKNTICKTFNKKFTDFECSEFFIVLCEKQNIAKITETFNKYGWVCRNPINTKGISITFGHIEKEPQQSMLEFAQDTEPMDIISLPVNAGFGDPFTFPSEVFKSSLSDKLIETNLLLNTEILKRQR